MIVTELALLEREIELKIRAARQKKFEAEELWLEVALLREQVRKITPGDPGRER